MIHDELIEVDSGHVVATATIEKSWLTHRFLQVRPSEMVRDAVLLLITEMFERINDSDSGYFLKVHVETLDEIEPPQEVTVFQLAHNFVPV